MDDDRTLCGLLSVVRKLHPETPASLSYHPDADPGDGAGWCLEVGDWRTHGSLDAVATAWRKWEGLEVPHATLELPGMPPKIRRKPRVLMSVVDAGSGGAEWLCPRCGWKDWIFTEDEKGPALSHREPCPVCNEVPRG